MLCSWEKKIEIRKFIVSFQNRIWIFPALALITIIIGKICKEACVFINGDILGLNLEIFGIFFYSALLLAVIFHKEVYPKDWLMKAITALVSIGVGAEYIFIKFLFQNNIYCLRCLISGIFFLTMFFVLIRHIKIWVVILLILFGAIFTSFTFNGSVIPLYAKEIQSPSFGNEKSKIEIIVYSDYFCSACRKIDNQINNTLMKLKDKMKIRFVDVPLHVGSLEYAEVFLYTYSENKNNLDIAIKVREILFIAAKTKVKQGEVLNLLKSQGIPFTADKQYAREIFRKFYNPLMKSDKINATPAIVIGKGNSRKTYKGTHEIMKALKEISSI